MNTIFEILPQKESAKFKQVILSYDQKNYKTSIKHLNSLLKKNPNQTGYLKRVQIDELLVKIFSGNNRRKKTRLFKRG
jgi:hypothetical protein